MPTGHAMQLPETLPVPQATTAQPPVGLLLDADVLDDRGSSDGLTLDEAIDRMMHANLDIRALRHELTQADADVLTAGLRTNPLVYMDTQFIPYGSFSNTRPGGPTQYDLNVTLPMDISHKRQARTVVARMARSTLEAQFQDVTRRQLDNLGRAFVGLQSARLDRLAAEAMVRRLERKLAELERDPAADRDRLRDTADHAAFMLERARYALAETIEAYDDAREGLGVILSMSPEEAARLEPRGSLRDATLTPPAVEEMESLALQCRPDLRAARLGLSRANAELNLQRANRFDDVYLFYDPITYQDNSPFGALSSKSWAIGLTFSLPVFNRNQGNIARAQSNIGQTRLELASLERRIASEVRLADREYRRSREAIRQIEEMLLPRARAMLEHRRQEFAAGAITLDDFEGATDDMLEVAQNLREAIVRHRRAMLDINTAVGLRILP
jgi:cobalt-zinc-cadmium efflux system outer membrane protein